MKPITIFILLIAILFQSCFPTYFDRVKVTSTPVNAKISNDDYRIKKLLIISLGNHSTRVVADNIHAALQTKMEKKGSETGFYFGYIFNNKEIPEQEKKDLATYDGFMLFLPKDTSLISLQKKFIYGIPVNPGFISFGKGYGKAYNDTFIVKLFDSEKELIYTGEIVFHFDPTKDEFYPVIADKLISELSKSHITLW